MNHQIRTWLNHAELDQDGEINNLPSLTIPDMTMSLEDLLNRHTQGKEIPTFDTNYDDDEEDFTPNPRTLDLADIQEMRERNFNYINHLQDEYEKIVNTPVLSVPEGTQATPLAEPAPTKNKKEPE